MSLLNVERIKLFSTKSPYWCLLLILVIGAGFSVLYASTAGSGEFSISATQFWSNLGLMVAMVMAALAMTTEYRFSTIRSSFLAVPSRAKVLVSKTLLLAIISGVTGLITAFIAYFLMKLIGGDKADSFSLSTGTDWRVVAGTGLIFAISAVIAVAVGTLIRQSAGAIAILLLWPLLVESLFQVFGQFGRDVAPWLPFAAGSRFTQEDDVSMNGSSIFETSVPSPVQGLLTFAGFAAVLWVLALFTLKRRDA